MIKIKTKAALIHLLIGLIITIPILAYLILTWYPQPFFEISGLKNILYILIITDIILGPFLTFIIFKPFKKNLKVDLLIIALLQTFALSYGLFIVYMAHPIYIVYAVDRFTLIAPKDINNKFNSIHLGSPILIYAKSPENLEEKQKITLETLSGGPDIDRRPEYYSGFKENINKVFNSSIKLEKINNNEIARNQLNKLLNNQKIIAKNCAFLALSGKERDIIWVWDKENIKPIGSLAIDPWQL